MMFNHSKKWKKPLVVIIALTLCLSLLVVGCSSSDSSDVDVESKGTVEFGYVNWAECVAVTHLWQVILEDMGYEVNLTMLDAAPLFLGLERGDIDVFMDAWLPLTHQHYWEEYGDNLDDYGSWYEGVAKVGLVVPSYVEIDSIDEMKDYADEFSSQIVGIDAGAGIMATTAEAMPIYGMDSFNLVQGSEAAMMIALDRAIQNEEWVAVTGWSPHWKFAKYDLKYLDDPENLYGDGEAIHTLANKDFTEREPEVAEMLQKFSMDDDQLGSLDMLIQEGMDPYDAAVQWKSENQDVVDSWIN